MTGLLSLSGASALRAGDVVEVRSASEIVATLDDDGRLEGLPFMPEMLAFCGGRYRVYKSAHKACDTIGSHGCLQMQHAVHLEDLRCDGSDHGGCEAGCLLYWKDAWLKRLDDAAPTSAPRNPDAAAVRYARATHAQGVHAPVATPEATETSATPRYSCQATRLLDATTPLRWWDLRQYVRDLASRNVRLRELLRYSGIALFNMLMRRIRFEGRHSFPSYPYVPGLAGKDVPQALLDLQPGELVTIRSRSEIMRTIDRNRRNRGLSFDVEMEPYCGKSYRVLRRVRRIIDEKTGNMLNISRDCLILDGVVCGGCLSRNRMFCPRSTYPYWREAWLKRAER